MGLSLARLATSIRNQLETRIGPVTMHQKRPPPDHPSETERFVTLSEAAALLQPYMPGKNAVAWLVRDSQYDPMIPCHAREGQNWYRRADLAQFVQKTFGGSATFNDMANKMLIERRGHERRAGFDRRQRLEVRLAPGIERRRGDGTDRRSGRGFDRRTYPFAGRQS